MKNITSIDERIEKLNKQKEELTRKVSLSLYTELSKNKCHILNNMDTIFY